MFSGAILLHLRDPVGALERIHGVLEPGGQLVLLEPFSPRATIRSPRGPMADFQPLATDFNWWLPNLAGLRGWLTAARFDQIERLGFHRPPSVKRMRQWQVAYSRACLDAPRRTRQKCVPSPSMRSTSRLASAAVARSSSRSTAEPSHAAER